MLTSSRDQSIDEMRCGGWYGDRMRGRAGDRRGKEGRRKEEGREKEGVHRRKLLMRVENVVCNTCEKNPYQLISFTK